MNENPEGLPKSFVDSILKEIADNDYNIVYNIFFKDARLTYFENH